MRVGIASAAWIAALLAMGFSARAQSVDALDAPPPNLAPASAHLAAILSAHDVAVGRPLGRDTVVEDWRFTDSGMSGTLHLERSGTDYHSRIMRGPFLEEYGQQNGHRWHRDQNGFVSPTTTTDDVTFFSQQVNEDAADPKNDASVAGQTQGADPAYVVKVQVAGSAHPEWIFYDVASGLITRVEWVHDGHRLVRTFDDFRTVDGVTSAWHVHDTWYPRTLDDDYVCTSMQGGVAISASQFAQPPSAPFTPYSQVALTIPAQMYDDGTIILRMTVNGRGLDMMLDTASPEDIIDEDVAKQMGLPTYGSVDRSPSGADVPFETLVRTATVGPLVRNELALDAMPFSFAWFRNTEVVGVLGYDFLAGNVFKIDYVNGTVQVLPASSFDSNDPVPGGLIYPLDFDDGFPFLSVGVGDVTSGNVLLANEIVHTEFFGTFLAAHPELFTGGGAIASQNLPFANNGSFGKRVAREWIAQPTSVHFGTVNFQQPNVRASNEPLYLSENRAVDAALGFDFLRFFDVYLDYPHGRVIVKPNALFMRVIHHA